MNLCGGSTAASLRLSRKVDLPCNRTKMANLSEIFTARQTNLIDWHGPLYSVYDVSSQTDRFALTRVSTDSGYRQGFRIKVRGGTMEINRREARDAILWEDTAPDSLEIVTIWGKGARSIRVWNVWERNGVTQAWLGNAGMRVVETGNVIRFDCSDGEGPPQFSNLIVELAMHEVR